MESKPVVTYPVLIIAIDPGTTSLKVAHFAVEAVEERNNTPFLRPTNNSARPLVLTNFPAYQVHDSNEISTSLIYNAQGLLRYWGHEATHHMNNDEFDAKYVVNHWKLGLHQSADIATARLRWNLHEVAERIWKGGKKPECFVRDLFQALSRYLFIDETSVLLEAHAGNLDRFRFIDIVIAVPPGWPRDEHRLFSGAAVAGLEKLPGIRIWTVSETECVLRAWMQDEGDSIVAVGDIVILLDLGGGTACISVFRYESPSKKERKWAHFESHSLSAGSEMVTQEFLNDFESRLEAVEDIRITPQLLHQAREVFNKKKTFVGDKYEDDIIIPIKGLKQDAGKGFREDKMIFPRQVLDRVRSYFRPSQDALLMKIEEVFMRIAQQHTRPKCCIAAGAYARNRLFRQKLTTLNQKLVMEIFYPLNIQDLVVRGACHARVQGDFREYAGSRLSVGILTYMLWSEIKHKYPQAHKRKFNKDPRWWSPVVSWALKKGTLRDPNKPISHDGTRYRKRFFEDHEEIEFTETILLSEAHPGNTNLTALNHSTAAPTTWRQNFRDLEQRKIPVDATLFTWKLRDSRIMRADGSWGPLDRTALSQDRRGRYLEYRYFLEVTQTDCRIAIEARFSGNRSERRYVGLISMGDCESEALLESYKDYVPEDIELPNEAQEVLNVGVAEVAGTTLKRTAVDPNLKTPRLNSPDGSLALKPKSRQTSLRDPVAVSKEDSGQVEDDDENDDPIPARRRRNNLGGSQL